MIAGLFVSALLVLSEVAELKFVHKTKIMDENLREGKCRFQAKCTGLFVMALIWQDLPLPTSHFLMGATCTIFGLCAIFAISDFLFYRRSEWMSWIFRRWMGQIERTEQRAIELTLPFKISADRIGLPVFWSFEEDLLHIRRRIWELNAPDALTEYLDQWTAEAVRVQSLMDRFENCVALLNKLAIRAAANQKVASAKWVDKFRINLEGVRELFPHRRWDEIDECLATTEEAANKLEIGIESPEPEVQPHSGDPEDPYAILGIDPSATDEEVNAAYRRIARQFHPDSTGSNRLMQIVNDAKDRIMKSRGSRK